MTHQPLWLSFPSNRFWPNWSSSSPPHFPQMDGSSHHTELLKLSYALLNLDISQTKMLTPFIQKPTHVTGDRGFWRAALLVCDDRLWDRPWWMDEAPAAHCLGLSISWTREKRSTPTAGKWQLGGFLPLRTGTVMGMKVPPPGGLSLKNLIFSKTLPPEPHCGFPNYLSCR